MENLTHALYIAFAAFVFVIAFSVSLYLIGKINFTAKEITSGLSDKYYDSLSLTQLLEDNEERNRSRIVGVDTIIPSLYRYKKESFAVKILDENGNLLQCFDTTTEGDVRDAKSGSSSIDRNKINALLSLYDDSNKECYMFGAPWTGRNEDAKARIDLYVNGSKGYINKVLVDYTSYNLKKYKNRKFKEVFTQYAYEGDTIIDDTNGEITSLTGNKQIATKIIIVYQLLP